MALLQIALLAAGVVSVSSAQSDWKVLNRFNVGGDGAWDYLTVDASVPPPFCHAYKPHHGRR